jgi:phage protein U
MFAALGMFVFSTDTALFDELQRRREWRHAASDRLGARAASQYVGPGEDTITLTGQIVPEMAGKYSSLDTLAAMADQGEAYPLINGAGYIFGTYVITGMDETQSTMIDLGVARKTAFTLSLRRVDDSMATASTASWANVGIWA